MRKEKIYKNLVFLKFKLKYESKGLSITKIAKGLNMSRENVYKAFHNNYEPTLKKIYDFVENYK